MTLSNNDIDTYMYTYNHWYKTIMIPQEPVRKCHIYMHVYIYRHQHNHDLNIITKYHKVKVKQTPFIHATHAQY